MWTIFFFCIIWSKSHITFISQVLKYGILVRVLRVTLTETRVCHQDAKLKYKSHTKYSTNFHKLRGPINICIFYSYFSTEMEHNILYSWFGLWTETLSLYLTEFNCSECRILHSLGWDLDK